MGWQSVESQRRAASNFPSDNCTPVRTSRRYFCRMWPTPLGFQIARVAVGAILADFRVGVRSLPLQGAEIDAEGDATSGPHGFSGCGEFPAFFPTRAMRSRRRARSASLSGARHGLAPKRNGAWSRAQARVGARSRRENGRRGRFATSATVESGLLVTRSAMASRRRRAADHLLPRGGTCTQPYVKGLTTMVNSIYNGYRMEDVWLDK